MTDISSGWYMKKSAKGITTIKETQTKKKKHKKSRVKFKK